MHVRRLEILADFLENDPNVNAEGKFHLSLWMGAKNIFVTAFKYSRKSEEHIPIQCKTVGCALGWATTIPAFRKAGLRHAQCPTYKTHHGFEAAKYFFDISIYTADMLFSMHSYKNKNRKSPKAVAKRIRDLIKLGEDKFLDKYERLI